MSETSNGTSGPEAPLKFDFGQITSLVTAEFQLDEALLENSIPTYYLKQPQETKQPFLRLLENLEPLNLIAFLRKQDGRVVLKVVSKPESKPSNVLVNWVLFFATIGTTFITGYLLSSDMMNPFLGGAAFTIAIMTVLGAHEMGHKLIANKRGMEATPPYFIPGPPPVLGFLGVGTFGAVIMQKSLSPNKDALFDVGASGPLIGFVVAVVAVVVGFPFSSYALFPKDASTLPTPLLFYVVEQFLSPLGPIPHPTGNLLLGINLHPVAFAGWVGLIVTMLNLLPAAMLDGGHVARALVGDGARLVLTVLSLAVLIISGYLPMALFVLFLAMYKHPGPLDDVSGLSRSRKLLTAVLVVVFVLCLSI
ncbi:MAG TPA: site-2 protease family protein [Candidatus Bathyarchaeia archaeon]|jgi:membrane-associated protease RseP (regulator of RpoE activity)|nr:site-2 protease family protein [Candidatus Bathyarchaeia archaeon]